MKSLKISTEAEGDMRIDWNWIDWQYDRERLEKIVMQFVRDAYPELQHPEILEIKFGSANFGNGNFVFEVFLNGEITIKVYGKLKAEITNLRIPHAKEYIR